MYLFLNSNGFIRSLWISKRRKLDLIWVDWAILFLCFMCVCYWDFDFGISLNLPSMFIGHFDVNFIIFPHGYMCFNESNSKKVNFLRIWLSWYIWICLVILWMIDFYSTFNVEMLIDGWHWVYSFNFDTLLLKRICYFFFLVGIPQIPFWELELLPEYVNCVSIFSCCWNFLMWSLFKLTQFVVWPFWCAFHNFPHGCLGFNASNLKI